MPPSVFEGSATFCSRASSSSVDSRSEPSRWTWRSVLGSWWMKVLVISVIALFVIQPNPIVALFALGRSALVLVSRRARRALAIAPLALQRAVQRPAIDPQDLRGALLVAAGLSQDEVDVAVLQLRQRRAVVEQA